MRRPLLAALTGLALAVTTALGPATAAVTPDAAGETDPVASGLPVARMPVADAPDEVAPGLAGAEGVVTAFVQLSAPSALDVAEDGGGAAAVGAATERIESLAEDVVPQTATTSPAPTVPQRLSVTTNLVAGTVVRGDAAQVRALAQRPEVVGVHRVTAKTVDDAAADVLTRVARTWRSTGTTGAGMRVGVIDTGVDYTHATFGGPGTPEAYAAAYGTDGTGPVPAGSTDPTVFLGGHDFAGPHYDAGGTTPGSSPVPVPDANPIDAPATTGGGHGTHVAATAFGLGVTPDGATFRGDHADVTDAARWQVAPGSAPGAGIYALKVVGDGGGSTHLTIDALEWAADPNGDHVLDDRLDVLVVPMGTDGAPADDPENLFVDRLADLGVLSVFSAGNGGDVTDVGGVPGSARSGLTVAWSLGDSETLDAVEVVTAPDDSVLGAHPAQASVAYSGPDVTAPVTFLGDDVTGCTPLTAPRETVAGTIVYLWWDDDADRECGSAVRWDNAQAAGAVGVLLGTELMHFPIAISGNATIPGAQLTAAATDALLPEVRRGGVVLRMGPSLARTQVVANPALADTLSPGSARGVHGSLGIIKPDVAAPGHGVWSAASGTGDEAAIRSGTSMAAAHVAGIATLVRSAHPGWTPAEVKAAVMNTATHDVHSGADRSGPVHGPARVGSGRVDALDAVRSTTLAYATEDPDLVSVTFGVVPVGERPVVARRTVTVQNTGPGPVRYRTSFDAATTTGGATITPSPATVEIPAGGRALVTLTLDAEPATLSRDLDPTSVRTYDLGVPVPREHVAALSGRLVLTSDDAELRVPVQAAPRRVSDLAAQPVTFRQAGTAEAPLALTGRAVDGGGWRSLVAPLQLVGTSPRLETPAEATSESAFAAGDLRYVGFSSTAPQVQAVGADPAADGVVGIGVVTQGEWAALGRSVLIVVDTDVDGDGTPDRRTVVRQTSPELDVTTAQTFDLATGALHGEIPVNGTWGDVDTTVFDNNVVVVPIALAALGAVPGQTPTFSVWTYSPDYAPDPTGALDRVDPFTVDPYAPEYWFDGGAPGSVLFTASAGSPVTVHRTADAATTASPLLVLHTHNATPLSRAQVVDVVAPLSTPTTTALAVTGDRVAGAELTLTASVEPADAAGSVAFAQDGRELGTVAVSDGSASLTVPLGAGTRTVTATFVPASPEWEPSTAAPVAVDVAQASSTVDLRLTDRAIGYGDATTAVVSVGSTVPASGLVEIRAGERVLASATLGAGGVPATARIPLPRDLEVGAHRIHAVYLGSTDVAGAASTPLRLRIIPARPAVTMDAGGWTADRGSRPIVTVTVDGPEGGPTPTGTVSLLVNLRRVGTAELGADGTAQFRLPRMQRTALVTVVYGGNGGYSPVVDMRSMRVR